MIAVLKAFSGVFRDIELSGESDFFDLGGDSLAAMEIMLSLEASLGVTVHPSLLLHHPEIADLSTVLAALLFSGTESPKS